MISVSCRYMVSPQMQSKFNFQYSFIFILALALTSSAIHFENNYHFPYGISFQILSSFYWVGQKVCSDFSNDVMEKPEQTFLSTQNFGLTFCKLLNFLYFCLLCQTFDISAQPFSPATQALLIHHQLQHSPHCSVYARLFYLLQFSLKSQSIFLEILKLLNIEMK